MRSSSLPVLLLFLCAATLLADSAEPIRSRIRRQGVVSTNVASIGYSHRLHALEIEFARGAIYRFLEVAPAVYQGLMSAQSKGHFIAENIRGKYRFVRVRPNRTNAAPSRLTVNERKPQPDRRAP